MPEKAANLVSIVNRSSRESQGTTSMKNMRFRRGRAAKACEVCHARKVRCDMTENFPCTNCKAFSLVCTPREGRTKSSTARKSETSPAETLIKSSPTSAIVPQGSDQQRHSPNASANKKSWSGLTSSVTDAHATDTKPKTTVTTSVIQNGKMGPDPNADLPLEISAGVSRGATKHNPRTFMFMGATSHAVLRDNDISTRKQTAEDPLIQHIFETNSHRELFPYTESKDATLRSQGAFLLPSNELSDHLVEHFFKFSHPFIPVLNRLEFMREYERDRDSPPLLLRQAVFCVGARTSTHSSVRDSQGSTRKVALTFYQRAKALYDAEYEKDSDIMMRAALLMGLAIDHPFSVTQNAFYWTRVAITLAQGAGLHRKRSYPPDALTRSHLLEEVRRQRRVWWTLFVRDVQTSMSYGRPIMINLEDCNVEMVQVEDFEGAEAETLEPGSPALARVLCFIQSVRLFEISGLIMRVQYSVGAERIQRQHFLPDVTQCDAALAEWVNQLPSDLTYSIRDSSRHEFVRSLLYLYYYTAICLAHRPQVSRLFRTNSGDMGQSQYPSWGIAFQAAHMISHIFENLKLFGELQYLPATTVYTAFLATMMLAYQLHSSRSPVVEAAQQAMTSVIASVKLMARTHETASWIAVLGEHLLHDDRFALRLARSMWPKRPRESADEDDVTLGTKRQAVKHEYNTPPNRPTELHLATRSKQLASSDNGLFPGMNNSMPGHLDDFIDEKHNIFDEKHNHSSSDEASIPDTLNMVDWYDFLMAAPGTEPRLDAVLNTGFGHATEPDLGNATIVEPDIVEPGVVDVGIVDPGPVEERSSTTKSVVDSGIEPELGPGIETGFDERFL